MISKQELENIANLAKLEIEAESFDKILNDMKNVVEFANKIGSADLNDESFVGFDGLKNRFRSDEVVDSYSQDEILRNCKTVEEGFFKLKLNDVDRGVDE